MGQLRIIHKDLQTKQCISSETIEHYQAQYFKLVAKGADINRDT